MLIGTCDVCHIGSHLQVKQLEYDLERSSQKIEQASDARADSLQRRASELEMQLKVVITDRNTLISKLQSVSAPPSAAYTYSHTDRPAARPFRNE